MRKGELNWTMLVKWVLILAAMAIAGYVLVRPALTVGGGIFGPLG